MLPLTWTQICWRAWPIFAYIFWLWLYSICKVYGWGYSAPWAEAATGYGWNSRCAYKKWWFCQHSVGEIILLLKKNENLPSMHLSDLWLYQPVLRKLYDLLFVKELEEKCYTPPHWFGFRHGIECADALAAILNSLVGASCTGSSLALASHDIHRAFYPNPPPCAFKGFWCAFKINFYQLSKGYIC